MLKPGLYEQILSRALSRDLEKVPERQKALDPIDAAEAPQILSGYVARVLRSALESMEENTSAQIALVNRLIAMMSEERSDLADQEVDAQAERLLQVLDERDPSLSFRTASMIPRPETSMSASSLFTGAPHEPMMYAEIRKELASADRVDMLVSFIRWSGLRLILGALQDFADRGGELRVITTSYMGATEVRAVEELSRLPHAHVRISYDTTRTRLHAKAYVFIRETGFSTAYVGSSNLSSPAMSSGLEWNLKLTGQDQPDTLRKIQATFESYWNSEEFESYAESSHERLRCALKAETRKEEMPAFLFDIRPYPYQQVILDQLRAEREVRNHFRNLVVAATGTGKTVIAALDYRAWRSTHLPCRLLFIAHREEILRQSLATFRAVLQDPNFGELWVGQSRPQDPDHLFISVQTLNVQRLWNRLKPDFYDYIVVDEGHHAAADSYLEALKYFRPQILLGLTATPERMDGRSILPFFDHHIAAEIRLPEAIDRKLLCPFQYFGVSDTVDLEDLKWSRGGYDRGELNRLYTLSGAAARRRAGHVLRSLLSYASDPEDVKALGFCVSVEHARFMADFFNENGFSAMALDSHSSPQDRQSAREYLVKGDVRILFVVDLYNEGVDIPQVNTVLFLRPTESLTVFLQQLGRGLRLSEGKDCLTVLDFIGAANRRYSFAEKFSALLGEDRRDMKREVEEGFPGVPRGCSIQLEKVAMKHVLDNIRRNLQGRDELLSRLRTFSQDSGQVLTFSGFLDYCHLTPGDLYRREVTFSRLCVEAGVLEDFHEAAEKDMSTAVRRLASVDSRRWIDFLLRLLPRLDNVDFAALPPLEAKMLRMFIMTMWNFYPEDLGGGDVLDRLYGLSDSPVMLSELEALLHWQYDHIDFVDTAADLGFVCPLDVHCSYSQRQVLAALDYANFGAMRQGVLYLPEKKTDVFFITLNKSDKDYSPTTMYEDYAMSPTLFHWQSQSTTSPESPTGQRYIHHRETGGRVLLFVREYKTDALGAAPYTFLGQADYVSHTGSRPMNILWRLEKPIPAKFLRRLRQAMG